MGVKFGRSLTKLLGKGDLGIVIGSPQRIILTGMVVAMVCSMGILGASGELFQPFPAYSPLSNHATFHVSVTPGAIKLGENVTIKASVDSYIHDWSIVVNITVKGPDGSGILAYKTATIFTNAQGKGNVSFTFPGMLSGSASTDVAGTYSVVAAFAQIYSEAFAQSQFKVSEEVPN